MNSFPCACACLVSRRRRTNVIISRKLLWSLSFFLPVGGDGDRLISPDFETVVWPRAGRPPRARGGVGGEGDAISAAVKTNRQSVSSPLPPPSSLLILPLPCAVFVVCPASAPTPSLSLSLSHSVCVEIQSQSESRSGEILQVPRESRPLLVVTLKWNPQTASDAILL